MDFRGTYKGGGGPDKTILNSAAQHDKEKVDVLVVYIRQPHDTEFQIPQAAVKLGIRYTDLVDRGKIDFRCLIGLMRLIRQNRIQVLHTRDDKTLLYGWLLKLLVPGLRLLHTCHSHADYLRKDFDAMFAWLGFRLRKRILIFLMKWHHRPILTISNDTRQRLIRSGLEPEDIQVLHNGIDCQLWRRNNIAPVLRDEIGMTPSQMLVGTVARITYDKDLPTFFEVAGRVNAQYPETRFCIVGDGYGNELQEAQSEVERLGLKNIVYFTGHRSDLKAIYASFDLFLMTSRTEGMPNTLLEAMALGLPVVSTAVGGVTELVADGETGILTPPASVAELTGAVCRLISDGELRVKYGKAARSRIEEHFDFSRRVRQMEEYYRQIASAPVCGAHT